MDYSQTYSYHRYRALVSFYFFVFLYKICMAEVHGSNVPCIVLKKLTCIYLLYYLCYFLQQFTSYQYDEHHDMWTFIIHFQLDLKLKEGNAGDTSTYILNGEWDLIGIVTLMCVGRSCTPHTHNHPSHHLSFVTNTCSYVFIFYQAIKLSHVP